MVRTIAVTLVAVLVPAPFAAQQSPPQPKFKTGITLVEVAASVRDGHGRFVPGLAQKDFEIMVDGRAVPIESFAAVSGVPRRPEEGRFVVLLFDDLATTPTLLERMRTIALSVVDRMGPFDEAAVLATNGDSMTSTTSRDEVRSRIQALQPFGKLDPMPGQSIEHALQAIADLTNQMASVERRRKVIVVIGSTGLFDKTRPAPGERAEVEQAWFDAARASARNNVAVYIIDPRGLAETTSVVSDSPAAPSPMARLAEESANAFSGASGFAGETGGLAFANTNNFNFAVDRIWSDIGNYYLLGYTAPESAGRETPKLSVHVKRAGVDVQARRTAG